MHLSLLSGFVLLEKLIVSGSRYALIFYSLDSLDKVVGNTFFFLTSSTILLFTISHLGTDNLILSRAIVGKNNGFIYAARIGFTILAAAIFLIYIDGGINRLTSLGVVLALIGMAIPVSQLESISNTDAKSIMANRLLPEIFSGSARALVIFSSSNDINLIILSFFASEIFYGIINIPILIKLIYKSEKKFSFRSSIPITKDILHCFFSVICLYGIQRADVLLLSSIHTSIGNSTIFIIKSQQFFDMAGLISFGLIPILNKYVKTKTSPSKIINVLGASCGVTLFLVINVVSLHPSGYSFLNYFMKDMSFFYVASLFYLGVIAYTFMTFNALNQLHFETARIVFICFSIKAILFFTVFKFGYPLLYCILSATFMAVAFSICNEPFRKIFIKKLIYINKIYN